MRDLRVVVPVVQADSDPAGKTPPSGFLFPNISRLASDAQPQLFAGVQKLVQQLYLEMFTDPLPNGVGSGFATALQGASEDTIAGIVNTGVRDLLGRMRTYQAAADLPADERLASLTVRELAFDATVGQFTLKLDLVTDAGTQVTVQPPLI